MKELVACALLLFLIQIAPAESDGRCIDCPRDQQGRIQRSSKAKHEFMKKSGYPNGRPGYVIDHIVPLACGGTDASSNMQWQTKAEAKTKDRIERKGC